MLQSLIQALSGQQPVSKLLPYLSTSDMKSLMLLKMGWWICHISQGKRKLCN